MELFHFPINVHAQNIGTQKHLLRTSFDIGIVKKVKTVSVLGEDNLSYKNTCIAKGIFNAILAQ